MVLVTKTRGETALGSIWTCETPIYCHWAIQWLMHIVCPGCAGTTICDISYVLNFLSCSNNASLPPCVNIYFHSPFVAMKTLNFTYENLFQPEYCGLTIAKDLLMLVSLLDLSFVWERRRKDEDEIKVFSTCFSTPACSKVFMWELCEQLGMYSKLPTVVGIKPVISNRNGTFISNIENYTPGSKKNCFT